MRVLIDLKSILEPFLWALFLVMVWKPVVDALEIQLERALVSGLCFCPRKEKSSSLSSLSRAIDEDAELRHILEQEAEHDEMESMSTASSIGRPSGTSVHPSEDIEGADTLAWRKAGGERPDARRSCQDIDGADLTDLVYSRTPTWRKSLARGLAVLSSLVMTLGIIIGLGSLVLESARHMKNHFEIYQKGAQNLADNAVHGLGYMFQRLPEKMRTRYETVTTEVMTAAQDYLYSFLGSFLNNMSSLLIGLMLTLLYTVFWLCSPVPISSSIDMMFRRYIMYKTMACCGYGTCVGLMLAFLSVDLAAVFGLTTFLLNYVPEVGPFVAMVLPCPIILLDSRLERPLLVCVSALVGQLGLKFAFSNIVEVKLIESDKKLRMHPVMILLSVGIFGYLWGPTGMLLSVPLMALVKISLFSDVVPASYRDTILVLLEGDRDAPRKHGLHRSSSSHRGYRDSLAQQGG
eukprot:TRINITY_DN18366_c0_g1_i1.p1 TRINITY_DN18366_c0_g1~~TRINITY_DN18366_c0_g1_i1.p1  ORF type:complete len:543 (-),score=58.55 TRINITY_DN18366_c0_g1_i1:272-1657(-)